MVFIERESTDGIKYYMLDSGIMKLGLFLMQ